MASPETSVTVAGLMLRLRSGDREAAYKLVSVLYPELRRLAAAKMCADGSSHSWQPSLLVNELYLQIIKVKSLPSRRVLPDRNANTFCSLRNMSCAIW